MPIPSIARVKDLMQERTGVPADQMVYGYYARLGAELLAERARLRAGMTTLAEWEGEKDRLRARLLAAIGPFPAPEPAQARIVADVAYDGYTLQKLLYLSHPESWTPANLFLPAQGSAPFPTIVMPPGHSIAGKAHYRHAAAYFALNGYAVLTLDFLGEGERQLGGTPDLPCLFASDAHNMLAMKMAPFGLNLNWFMMYDLRRAVDYLATRAEIDMSRLAMTGGSGGGTATFYGGALDERIRALAPATAVHSLHARFLADDAEQTFFDHARQGLDYPDVAAFLLPPRPLLILGNTRDIWPLEGTQYVVEEARPFYRMHGAEDRIELVVADRGHGWDAPQFAQILSWFNRWLGMPAAEVGWEEAMTRSWVTEEDTRVTQRGNIYWEGYRAPEATVRAQIATIAPAPNADETLAELLAEVSCGLAQVGWEEIDRYRVGELEGRRIVFAPDAGLWLPAEVLVPPQPRGVVLLLDAISRLEATDWQIAAAREGWAAIRPDLRGFGDSVPADDWPDRENWYRALFNGKPYTLFATAMLCGRHLVLDRARDILALCTVARAMGLHGPLTLRARFSCAPAALFAALASAERVELALEGGLPAYRSLLDEEMPAYSPDLLLTGLLHNGIDLPDLYRRMTAVSAP